MANSIATRMRRAAVLAACVLGAMTPTALAQDQGITVNDLRRENDALRQKIDQMSSQLDQSTQKVDELEARIRQLTAQVEALRRQLATQGAAPQDNAGTPIPIDPEPLYATPNVDEPFSSPEALFLAVQADYEEERAEQRWDDMLETRMRRQITEWARGASRRFRSKVEWLVEVTEVRDISGGQVVVGRVLDPETGYPFGDMQVTLELEGSLARKVRERPNAPLWRVVGNVNASPRMNPDRTTQGFFNVPAFIGPYAEFVFEVRTTGLVVAAQPDELTDGQER